VSLTILGTGNRELYGLQYVYTNTVSNAGATVQPEVVEWAPCAVGGEGCWGRAVFDLHEMCHLRHLVGRDLT